MLMPLGWEETLRASPHPQALIGLGVGERQDLRGPDQLTWGARSSLQRPFSPPLV